MADVTIAGAGVVGLTTAMLLAKDGHNVTVLERDGQPPPDPEQAWATWERQGVNQFHLLHYFLPRFRSLLDAELPEAVTALDAAGALRLNPVADMPAEMNGGVRPDDGQFETITGRRPVVEAAIAAVAEATPGVTVRRGVPVSGLMAAGEAAAIGVCTEDGEHLRADLVVDAAGRRSSLPKWIQAIGGAAPVEELEDCGFVYYGRHFRGTQPAIVGPLLQHYGSISVLSLPADNGTWGLGLIASSKDAAMRKVADPDRWSAVVKSLPLVAHWLDGEPIDERVLVMAKIEDRHRTFVVDGRPVATGVVAVGDSWACTNPSVGRGASIGLMHAVALRDLLREGIEDPTELALAWHDATYRTVEPYYRNTLSFDRHRLADIEALIDGREPAVDEEWDLTNATAHAAGQDFDCMRAYMRLASVLSLPEEELADPTLLTKVIELGQGWRDVPPFGPTREELVKLTT